MVKYGLKQSMAFIIFFIDFLFDEIETFEAKYLYPIPFIKMMKSEQDYIFEKANQKCYHVKILSYILIMKTLKIMPLTGGWFNYYGVKSL